MEFKKLQKSKVNLLKRKKNINIKKGVICVISLENGIFLEKQYESIRKSLSRVCNRHLKLWNNIKFDYPVIKKAKNSRMGKGKSKIKYICSRIKKNQIIFELSTPYFKDAESTLNNLKSKIPFKVKVKNLSLKYFI